MPFVIVTTQTNLGGIIAKFRFVNQPLVKELTVDAEAPLTVDAEAPLTVAADVPPPQSHTKRSRTYPLTRGDFASLQAQIEYICRAVEAMRILAPRSRTRLTSLPLAWPLQKKVILARGTSSS